jgi:tight adherence protein C
MLSLSPELITFAAFAATLAVAFALRGVLVHERATSPATPPEPLLAPRSKAKGLAATVGSLAQPRTPEGLGAMRRHLSHAGFEGKRAYEVYSLVRATLALGLPALTWLALRPSSLFLSVLLALITAAAGYYGPVLYVENRRRRRREALLKPFPNALDLLVSSVEAGLGLDAALRCVATEMETAAPLLAHELQRTNQEFTAGVPRLEALRRLDDRTGLTEMTSLVNVLVQAERYGTGVGRALRAHADLTRHKRMLAAEGRAARVAPKLTIVTVVLIMPSLLTVLLGPTIVNVITYVIPLLAGSVP